MKTVDNVRSCNVNTNGSQDIKYEIPEFPVYLQKITLPEQERFGVTDHWHDDIEFIYCISGCVNYIVEGKPLAIKAGNGVFVNSRKLHVVSKNQDSPSEFYCIILHPVLLSSSKYVDAKYIEPILRNTNLPYYLFHSDIEWENKILNMLENMFLSAKSPSAALMIQRDFFELWRELYDNLDLHEPEVQRPSHNLSILKDMISFIQRHYQDKISLDDIASAGNVGKTMCINIFSNYVNKTPGIFLKEYRIQQSIELLLNTDMSITEISYDSGFSGASYYTKLFRESTGLTPLEYRKQKGGKS